MSKKFSAIKYTPGLKLDTILKAEDDMINVFVPVEHFSLENPAFSGQLVYGRRPYSVKSDLVAILEHMGILFPVEKQKKNQPDLLFTSPNALLFGTKDINFDERRKIEDDFRFYGVVVTVTAVEPIEHFQSVPGFGLASQATHDLSFISIDIIDYTFISEFEPMPTLVDDPDSIVTHFSKVDYFMPKDTENTLVYQYSPDLFADDKEGFLFQDYKVSFLLNDIQLNFKSTKKGFLLTKKMTGDGLGQDAELIETNIRFSDISFMEKGIKVKGVMYEPISRFTVEKVDKYEY